ncbi:MAG TPA: hypothetical protein VMF13_05265 [Luteitalea sp.]|nr:hypothetical protein [Luteitalea sp.]
MPLITPRVARLRKSRGVALRIAHVDGRLNLVVPDRSDTPAALGPFVAPA